MEYYGYGVGIGAFVWLIVLLAVGARVGLAFIPAVIARDKGYSYGGFWALGFFFFLVGLIVALCLDPKPGSAKYTQQAYYPPQPPPYGPYGQYGQPGYPPQGPPPYGPYAGAPGQPPQGAPQEQKSDPNPPN